MEKCSIYRITSKKRGIMLRIKVYLRILKSGEYWKSSVIKVFALISVAYTVLEMAKNLGDWLSIYSLQNIFSLPHISLVMMSTLGICCFVMVFPRIGTPLVSVCNRQILLEIRVDDMFDIVKSIPEAGLIIGTNNQLRTSLKDGWIKDARRTGAIYTLFFRKRF